MQYLTYKLYFFTYTAKNVKMYTIGGDAMAKKTLYDFRAENGIWRSEVAEKTGIDEETLEKIEQQDIPEEIAEKVIKAYNLSPDYFTFDPEAKELRYTPEKPFTYFLNVVIIWQILICLLYALITFPTTMAGMLESAGEGIFRLLEDVCQVIITAFSGVYLSSYIMKKTSYGKEISQFDFIYPYLPAQVTICFSVITKLLPVTFSENIAILVGFSSVISVVSLVLQGIATAFLLKSRIENNEKTVKRISMLAIGSWIVYIAFYVIISAISKTELSPFKVVMFVFEFVLLLAVIFGLLVGSKKMTKLNKFWLEILPIGAMVLPTIISTIYNFI